MVMADTGFITYDNTSMITLKNLALGHERHPAVHHIDLTLMRGSLTALIGPNGAGKSTLLKGLAGILKPLEGVVQRNAISQQEVAYLPQNINIDREFPINVFDMVAMGLWRQIGAFGSITQPRDDKVRSAIATVGLVGLEETCIGALSDGQLQRALFARLLLQDAELILLDEPFNAIDTVVVDDMLVLIQQWHAEQRTVIVAFHNLHEIKRYFPDSLILAKELVAFGPTAQVLTPDNLEKAQRLCKIHEKNTKMHR